MQDDPVKDSFAVLGGLHGKGCKFELPQKRHSNTTASHRNSKSQSPAQGAKLVEHIKVFAEFFSGPFAVCISDPSETSREKRKE